MKLNIAYVESNMYTLLRMNFWVHKIYSNLIMNIKFFCVLQSGVIEVKIYYILLLIYNQKLLLFGKRSKNTQKIGEILNMNDGNLLVKYFTCYML